MIQHPHHPHAQRQTTERQTMTILQIAQGRVVDLAGENKDAVVDALARRDRDFLEQNPTCRKWFAPAWRVMEVALGETAPWGYEWYRVDSTGKLQRHSANVDSSG